MDSRVLLGVIGNGRSELLVDTVSSLLLNVNYNFVRMIMINDTGDRDYHNYLVSKYSDFFEILSHETNKGLSGSVASLWSRAVDLDVDYIFHVEEDFIFNSRISISNLINILESNNQLAQVALKRQPVNQFEASIGGFMNANPDSYHREEDGDIVWLSHRNFFTLNPSLYPRWVVDIGWQNGWGEKEFADALFADPGVSCGFLGEISDDPLVFHTGSYRAPNWML